MKKNKKYYVVALLILVTSQVAAYNNSFGSTYIGWALNLLAEHREHQLLLEFENALSLQRIDDFQPFASHISHRIVGVDVVYNP